MVPISSPLPAPAGTVRCLLCEGILELEKEKEGGTARYDRHLRTEHGVWYNRSWLIEQTLAATTQEDAAAACQLQKTFGRLGSPKTVNVETDVDDSDATELCRNTVVDTHVVAGSNHKLGEVSASKISNDDVDENGNKNDKVTLDTGTQIVVDSFAVSRQHLVVETNEETSDTVVLNPRIGTGFAIDDVISDVIENDEGGEHFVTVNEELDTTVAADESLSEKQSDPLEIEADEQTSISTPFRNVDDKESDEFKNKGRKRKAKFKIVEDIKEFNSVKKGKYKENNDILEESAFDKINENQSMKNLVKSALRQCKVDLKNWSLKERYQEDNENNNCSSLFKKPYPRYKNYETDSNSNHFGVNPVNSSPSSPSNMKSAFKKPKYINIQTQLQSDFDWCDGNTFTCAKCMFKSRSLTSFSAHVKSYHRTTLARFSGCFKKTNVKYQCKCCNKQVYHEKKVIKEHIESHLLSLEKYAKLYEKTRFKHTSSDKESTSVRSSPLSVKSHDLCEVTTQSQDLSAVIIQSPDMCKVATPSQMSVAAASSPSTSSSFSLGSHDLESQSISSLAPPTTISAPPGHSNQPDHHAGPADKFVYTCPFHGCDFHTDLQGMKMGPAAEHGIEVHQVSPWEVKQHGLKWKKMSLEKRMRQIFGEA